MHIDERIHAALARGRPVVALESTLISHGLPWPVNFETAMESERAVRDAGAEPATIGILDGIPVVGMDESAIKRFATTGGIRKASRRDIGYVISRRESAATTVSTTMLLAHQAGIAVFATGGIGGVHRPPAPPRDVSADLTELARTPVCVVCAGAKSILDLPNTLEFLETQGVPVVGYRTSDFPAFYVRESGLPVTFRLDAPMEVAAMFDAHRRWAGGGMLVAQPISPQWAIPPGEFQEWLEAAEADAASLGIGGAALTPFLLKGIAGRSNGSTLRANRELIVANARLAAEIAGSLQTFAPADSSK